MTVLSDWELWACAYAVESRYGDRAEEHARSRMAEHERLGDLAGEDAWRSILERVGRLRPAIGALN